MKQYKQPYFKLSVITTVYVLAASTTDPAGLDNENWFSDLGGDVYD